MKILCVDTSTRAGSITLSEQDRILGEFNVDSGQTHSARLLPGIDALLKSTGLGLADTDALAVICGPGSFTGLRIGLATVKGLGYMHSKPIIAVDAFDAWFEKFSELQGVVIPVLDAGRGEIYARIYGRGSEQDQILSPGSVDKAATFVKGLSFGAATFVGHGAEVHRSLIIGRNQPGWTIRTADLFLGRALARIAHRKLKSSEVVSAAELEPYYLRKSDAELNWKES